MRFSGFIKTCVAILIFSLLNSRHVSGEEGQKKFPDSLLNKNLEIMVKPTESRITFELPATLHSVDGETGKVNGWISGVPGNLLSTGKVSIRVDVASLETGIGKRDEIMRAEVLEAAKYPEIEFKSTGISYVRGIDYDDMRAEIAVEGVLILHGETKKMVVPVKLREEDGRLVAIGKFDIKLADFKIKQPSFLFFTTGDSVSVKFKIVGEMADKMR